VGLIQWSLSDPGELSEFFEIDVSPGMTGNDIVTNMEFEIDNSFSTDIIGNQLTVDGAIGNLGICPAEVDMEWEVSIPPGDPIPHPDFPIAPRPVDYPSLSLFIAAPDGSSAPCSVHGETVVYFKIVLTDARFWVYNAVIPFDPSMTTDDLNRAIDSRLRNSSFPEGLSYVGLNNGFPTIAATNGFRSFSVRTSANTSVDPGFVVGYFAQGAEPVCPENGRLVEGVGEIGNVRDTCGSDDRYWAAHGTTFAYAVSDPVVQFELNATAPVGFDGGALSIDIEASKENNHANMILRAYLFDFSRNRYTPLTGSLRLSMTDTIQNFRLPAGADSNDFLSPRSNEVQLLIQTIQSSGRPNVRTKLDEALFNFN
jgi:hypothetical protein